MIAILGYVLFLWATTIHDTVTKGSKYGFTIGNTKHQTYLDIVKLRDDYPNLVVYTYVTPTYGGQNRHIKLDDNFELMNVHQQWRVYLKGDGEYFNSVRLNFDSDKLINFYRHRQYYELP